MNKSGLEIFLVLAVFGAICFATPARAQVELADSTSKKEDSTTADCSFSFTREGGQIKFNQDLKVTKSGISGTGKGYCRVWAEDGKGESSFSRELEKTVGADTLKGTANKTDRNSGVLRASTFDSGRFESAFIFVSASDGTLMKDVENFVKGQLDALAKGKLSELIGVRETLDLGGAIIKRVK